MAEESRSWLLPAALIVAALLAGLSILLASQAMAKNFSLLIYFMVNLIVLVDVIDFCLRFYFRRVNSTSKEVSDPHSATSIPLEIGHYTPYQKRVHLRPYTLVASVHNLEDDLDEFLQAMEPYRDRLWIIDDGSTDNTLLRIRQAGWRCLDGVENRKKPGALRLLLANLPREIETVLVLDPDITIRNSRNHELSDLETVIFDFQRSGMAALCFRIAISEDGFMARLQALEFCAAFSLGRQSLADYSVNSGVSLYRRDALAFALDNHSLSVYAEDLENSVVLLASGERIYYDGRLVVNTEGKRTWRDWFSQRVGWAYGFIKVYLGRFEDLRRVARRGPAAVYQFLVYMGVLSLLLQPFKLVSLALLILSFARGMDGLLGLGWIPDWRIAEPVYFVSAFAKYTLLSFGLFFAAVPRPERMHILPVVPFYFLYALALTLPTSIGYANWICLRLWGRRVFRDHYQEGLLFTLQSRRNQRQPAEGI